MTISDFTRFIINHPEEFSQVVEAFLHAYDQTLENQQWGVEQFETDAGKQLATMLSSRLARDSEKQTKEQRLARTQPLAIAAGVAYALHVGLANHPRKPQPLR